VGGGRTRARPRCTPFAAAGPADWGGNHLILVLDSMTPAKAVEPWVHSAIASLDPTVPAEMEVLNQTVNRLADQPRFETALLAFFAFAGVTLAVGGLSGLMAFLTTQRTHEIGIRMALGATRENNLRALLFQISRTDLLTFVLVPLILSLATLIAILIPARAGMRVEPAATLRAE
jgi:putative ABC transport system permease protein